MSASNKELQYKAAIIAATSALVGSFLGVIGGAFTSNLEYKHMMEQKRNEQQVEVYEEFIRSLQLFANNPDGNFEGFQTAFMALLILGEKGVANSANTYYNALINSVRDNVLLSKEEHDQYLTNIINSIRASLNEEEIEKITLATFSPINK